MPNTDTVMLTIRLPRDLRDQFVARLEVEDQTASQVLRRAIRQFLLQGGEIATPYSPSSLVAGPKPQGATIAAPSADGAGSESTAFAGIRAMLEMDE